MASERIVDSTLLAARSDQYGLDATLYTLLTGDPPFKANSVADLVLRRQKEIPKSPLRVRMGVDERFRDVVMKIIRQSPDDRYRSASVLLKDLIRAGELAGLEADDASQWIG